MAIGNGDAKKVNTGDEIILIDDLGVMQTVVAVNKGVSLVATQATEVEATSNANIKANANERLPTVATQAIDIELVGNVNAVTTGNVDVRNTNVSDEIVLVVDPIVTQTTVTMNEGVPLAATQFIEVKANRNANMEADANKGLLIAVA